MTATSVWAGRMVILLCACVREMQRIPLTSENLFWILLAVLEHCFNLVLITKLLQSQQRATGYPRFRQLGPGRALKIDAVTAANQKSLAPIQQEVMRSAGIIHQPDTLVPSQGRSPDGDTHALHRFIVPLTNRLKQKNTSNDDVC